MVALVDAPSVVFSPVEDVDAFPEILAVAADPDPSVFAVHGHPPGIPQAECPAFSTGVFHRDKGIVLRDRVGEGLPGVVDIDAQDGAVEVGDVLAGEVEVRVPCAIAGGDVEHAIEAEEQISSIVSRRGPLDDRVFGFRIHNPAGFRVEGEAGDPVNTVWLAGGAVAEDKDLSVFAVLRVEGEAIEETAGQLVEELGFLYGGIILYSEDPGGSVLFASLGDDEQLVRSRFLQGVDR